MDASPVLWLFVALIDHVHLANVLIMPSSLFPVHRFTMCTLAEELIKRDHQSNINLPSGVHEIFWKVSPADRNLYDLYVYRNHSMHSRIWHEGFDDDAERTTAWMASIELCKQVLTTRKEEFNKIVATNFTTVIIDDLYNPCGLLLVGLQRSTYIYWSLTSLRTESAWANQSPSPPSYLPVSGTGFTDDLTFLQRLHNIASYFRALYIHQHLILSRMDKLFREYYTGNITAAFYIERNASVNFINTPQIFDFARPYMPRVMFVGALHCHSAKHLSGQLHTFINDASDESGVILFSSGFTVQWSKASEQIIDAFISSFTQLPNIRFVWQYNGPQIKNLPPNVYIAEWLPQQDILGNRRTRAHISMGGLNSVIESVWHGVPVIGIQLTASARDNLLRLSARNVAVILSKADLIHAEKIVDAIKRIHEPSYKKEMLIFQDMVTDVPYTELNHSAFWVEFIERHNEVPYARSGADELTVLQYFMADIILFIALLTLLFFFIFYGSLKYILRILLRLRIRAVNKRTAQK